MIRTMLTAGAGTSSAYVAGDQQIQAAMLKIVEGTPMDPAVAQYAMSGMNPAWAFATAAIVGMGPIAMRTMQDHIKSLNVRAERRLEAELGGLIEKGPNDAK